MSPAIAASVVAIAGLVAIVAGAYNIDHQVSGDYARNGLLLVYFVGGGLLLMLSTTMAEPLVEGALQVCGCMCIGICAHYWGLYLKDIVRPRRHKGDSSCNRNTDTE